MNVKITTRIDPPLFGFVRFDECWQQVKVTHYIRENGEDFNIVELPSGKVITVPNRMLEWSLRPKRFTRYPKEKSHES